MVTLHGICWAGHISTYENEFCVCFGLPHTVGFYPCNFYIVSYQRHLGFDYVGQYSLMIGVHVCVHVKFPLLSSPVYAYHRDLKLFVMVC